MDEEYEDRYLLMDFDEKPGSSDAIQAILKGDFELVAIDERIDLRLGDGQEFQGTFLDALGTDLYVSLGDHTITFIGQSDKRLLMQQIIHIPAESLP